MKEQTKLAIKLLEALTERAKELTCLYAIEEVLKTPDADIEQVCNNIIRAIPPGWQYPEVCQPQISLEGKEIQPENFKKTPWLLSANVLQQNEVVGTIRVYYTQEMPEAEFGPFLREEKKLIETIADRLSHFLTYRKMRHVFQEWQASGRDLSESRGKDWEAVLDLIRQTDNALFLRISNKMLNHLCWSGIEEAEELRQDYKPNAGRGGLHLDEAVKRPELGRLLGFSTEFTQKIFRIAANRLSGSEILSRIHMWIQEDKLSALLQVVRRHLPLSEISTTLRRYFGTTQEEADEHYPIARSLKVLLIGRILSDQQPYINLVKDCVNIEDLYNLLRKVIFSTVSQGRLGGKGAGLFLSSQILNKVKKTDKMLSSVRTPKTWYISSDMMFHFIQYNNMDEVIGQKYKGVERVRLEYTHVTEMFAQSGFPPEMVTELSEVLDDFGDSPLAVRSSSLLEDRMGSAFFGKYKTVFLGNQGTKEERLHDLMHAVAEVYASIFGPDPIEYRAERGLLDFSEQMGVMIQEAVGTRIGSYFFPVYSGVARSRNDFRWASEIKPEDGVIRIIPGFGTRAMDRTSDEHPIMVIPGRPSFVLDRTVEESNDSAPKRIDVINLETNSLQTVELTQLLKELGEAFPHVDQILSVPENGRFVSLEKEKVEIEKEQCVVTFAGLITASPFILEIRNLLKVLEDKLGVPVVIEFASDGEHLYLLQCRPQTFARAPRPTPIPKGITRDKIVFSANRYVSNGLIPNITHIVYLDPKGFEELKEPSHHAAIKLALGKLNQVLPKRQFVFIGHCCWGGRDDNRGATGLQYHDIKNAAVLVELFNLESNGETGLSPGIHSLQDLMDSDIRYLPIFPDDESTCFNKRFLTGSPNAFPEMLPEYAFLSDLIRVIDLSKATDGKIMQVLMNADLDEAVGIIAKPEEEVLKPEKQMPFEDGHPENYWRWRQRMADQMAAELDPHRFGVAGFYIFGSTKNGTAGPASDIDILIHFRGTEKQREDLRLWLEGWSLCLDEINYLQTGYRSKGLLDVHIVTDEDITNKTSYAVKINAVTDAARPLNTKKSAGTCEKIEETERPYVR
jgi:predicted nucleotidyltransferase